MQLSHIPVSGNSTFHICINENKPIICHNSVRFSGMVHGNRIHYLSTVCSLPFNLALFVELNCIGDVSVLCYLLHKATWQIVQIGPGSPLKWYVSFIPVIDFRAYMNFLEIANFLITKAKGSLYSVYCLPINDMSKFCILSSFSVSLSRMNYINYVHFCFIHCSPMGNYFSYFMEPAKFTWAIDQTKKEDSPKTTIDFFSQ